MISAKKTAAYLAPFIGFLIILLTINVYQYYSIKQDVRTNLIQVINEAELKEIQAFFTSISSKISIVRDWGKNGVLDLNKHIDLNKKFIPLIEHQPFLSALVLADSGGNEYLLFPEEGRMTTRIVTQKNGKTDMHFAQWSTPDSIVKKWKETDEYDPRKRPWFHEGLNDNEIHVTQIYTYHHSKKEGFTLSASWNDPRKNHKNMVFGIDIRLEQINNLLTSINKNKPTLLFLVEQQRGIPVTSLGRNAMVASENQADQEALTITAIINRWRKVGSPANDSLILNNQGENWIASFQPLDTRQKSIWLGTAATEKSLLQMLNASFFRIEPFEFFLAGGVGLLIFLLLWKLGLFNPEPIREISPLERFNTYLQRGEGAEVEFKSTVRMNLKTEKQGKEIELAWLKALCAFLNSKGGALLIGVDDSGMVIGLDADGFESDDRCLLHLKNLINQHIGAEFSSYITLTILNVSDNQAVMVEGQPTGIPVFLKIGKNEEYYIRSGPSSVKLTPSQMIRYVLQHQQQKN